jgi:signal transduction histidine kinase/ligand-binding sensor domain-containing protein
MMGLLNLSRSLRAGMAALCLVGFSHALDPNRAPAHYIREQWRIEREFPGGIVHAISQTPDGYLWIGTDTGLIRFDGFNFQAAQLSPLAPANTPVLGLTTDNDGSLLIRLQGAGVLRRKNGRFEIIMTGAAQAASQVTAMWHDGNGPLLMSDLMGVTIQPQNGQVEVLAYANVLRGSAPVISMASTADGKIWLGTLNSGLFYLMHGQATSVNMGLPYNKINCLLPIGANEIWVGTDGGVFRWNGVQFSQVELPPLGKVQVRTLLRDRDANIWVGTERGLLRISPGGTSLLPEKDPLGEREINALFEDREGNLWVGGTRGVERIRDSAFQTYSPVSGLTSESNGPVHTDSENRTWFAPLTGGLYWLKNGRAEPVREAGLQKDVVYSIAGQKDETWVGRQHGGVTRLRFQNGLVKSVTYTQQNGLAQNSVYAVYQARDGTVWAGTVNGGVSSFKDGRFVTYTTANGLSSNMISSILETRDGTIWFATPNGLNAWSNGHWRTYSSREGLPSDSVNCLFEDSSSVLWIGTANGLASLSSGHIQVFREAPDSLHKQIFGLVEDRNGWLWIATSNHLLRVRREKLLRGALQEGDVREFGLADGLRSTEGVKRSRSMVADALGRIWFSTSRGLSVVDPSHLVRDAPPAIVHLDAVAADGSEIDVGNSIHIPPSRRRITFSYTGLSLAVPERIRYRYFLESFDRNWSEPTAAREAAYTNLGAGSYRFRVVASNSDGIWNGSENVIAFEVDPVLWQTWWFRSACIVTVALLAWMAYRYRVRQVTARLDMQFQERISERTRIAGELHDTLLQSVQGLLLHFQRARNLLPANPVEAVQRLDVALDRAEQAIVEGRNAIHDLRSSTLSESDLAQALTALGAELGPIDGKDGEVLRVVVEGAAKPLRPILRDDVYRIVREALRNAFRHANAQHIEAEIVYEEKLFRVRIRDDGEGISPQSLEREGPAGHWGLVGMRERAKRIGGQLEIWSEHNAGTEIELVVPGSVAYESSSASTGFQLFSRKAKRTP